MNSIKNRNSLVTFSDLNYDKIHNIVLYDIHCMNFSCMRPHAKTLQEMFTMEEFRGSHQFVLLENWLSDCEVVNV